MRVAMVGWEYPPWTTGGLGTHCTELVRALVGRGARVEFFFPVPAGPRPAIAPVEGVTFHAIPIPVSLGPYATSGGAVYQTEEAVESFTRAVCRAAAGVAPDVVHAHDWMGIVPALTLAEAKRVPLVLTMHSTEFDRAAEGRPDPDRVELEREGLRRAAATIAVSASTRAGLISRFGADPARVLVIHNGVDVARFAPAAPRAYEGKGKRVLFLGRLTRQKGPDVFLDAAALLLKEHDLEFVIAGDGELRPALMARARRLGIRDQVRFLGRVSAEDVPRLYREADVYAMPSRSEPFGISALEALASGTPTVISRGAGVCEVAPSVVPCEVGDPRGLAETLSGLLADPEARRAVAVRGRADAARLTWTRAAEETLALYRRVASPAAPLEAVAAAGARAPSGRPLA